MAGRWHVMIRVGESVLAADHADPIAEVMRRARFGDSPESSDLQTIIEWWRENYQQSERCKQGTCDHQVI